MPDTGRAPTPDDGRNHGRHVCEICYLHWERAMLPCWPMPSMLHEGLVALFENWPVLAPEIIQDILHHPLPTHDRVDVKDSNLSQLVPTEYRADLVLLLSAGEPVFAIVVEVQLGRDADKRFSWPLYAAALRAKFRCPSCVLVVTADRGVADWARHPIDTGQPGSPFVPLVLGPGAVPRITDTDEARRAPEQAMLSVFAHGKDDDGLAVALSALAGATGLDKERSMLYCDLVHLAVGKLVRRKLEKLMENGTYEYQSDFARKYINQGRAEGRAEGEAKGRAEDVLKVLAARGIDVSDELRGRILSCTDLATLDRWIARAAVKRSTSEIFDDIDSRPLDE